MHLTDILSFVSILDTFPWLVLNDVLSFDFLSFDFLSFDFLSFDVLSYDFLSSLPAYP